jgi:hypothetical protein
MWSDGQRSLDGQTFNCPDQLRNIAWSLALGRTTETLAMESAGDTIVQWWSVRTNSCSPFCQPVFQDISKSLYSVECLGRNFGRMQVPFTNVQPVLAVVFCTWHSASFIPPAMPSIC